MKKNTDSVSDIFVKKIVEKGQKLFTKDEILILWSRSGGSKTRESYAISLLLGRELLIRVARDVYMRSGEDGDLLYWEIINKLIMLHAPSGAIIGGEKALEIHMMNYSIPSILVLYTRHTPLRVRLTDGREVHFRTLVSGTKTKNKNLYPTLVKFADSIDALAVVVPQKEIALLEALSLREHESGIAEANVMRFLTKNHSALQSEVFIEIVKYRYIRAINRLREIAKNEGYEGLYQATLSAIKKEGGGCFLTL